MSALLEVRDLRVQFDTARGAVRAVDGIDFAVDEHQVLGLVGESGSGKTMASMAVLGLVPPPGRVASGQIRFEGQDLRALPPRALRAMRGRRMAMVFQNPAHSLNPLQTVGTQLGEIVRHHERVSVADAKARVAEMLRLVGLPDPASRLRQYPHEMSGGMKQRVCIARALLCRPALVLADEPTTALDVTIQAQILDLMAELKTRLRTSTLLVTHDMGVVARLADRITVLYAGRVCETADARTIFNAPAHPYTIALLESVPRTDRPAPRGALPVIAGRLPDPAHPPRGCRFHPRCPEALPECAQVTPLPTELAPGHVVACLRRGSTAC